MSNSAAPEWRLRETLANAPLSRIPDPSVQRSVSTATLPVDSYQTEKVAVSGPSTVTYRQSDADELGQLREELASIQERRSRLMQLHELNEREEQLKRQIAEAERRS